MNKFILKSEKETKALGSLLAKHARKGMCFSLLGDLAAGKTTFTKGIALGLNIKSIVNSPTFTILRIYREGTLPLFHVDAYRLKGNDYDLGLDEFADEGLTVIEWPDYYEALPSSRLEISFTYIDDNTRQVVFNPIGEEYDELLKECNYVDFMH